MSAPPSLFLPVANLVFYVFMASFLNSRVLLIIWLDALFTDQQTGKESLLIYDELSLWLIYSSCLPNLYIKVKRKCICVFLLSSLSA